MDKDILSRNRTAVAEKVKESAVFGTPDYPNRYSAAFQYKSHSDRPDAELSNRHRHGRVRHGIFLWEPRLP